MRKCFKKGIVLPDGASLVLKGENHITTDAGTMIEAKGSLKIDGGGSLIGYSNGKYNYEGKHGNKGKDKHKDKHKGKHGREHQNKQWCDSEYRNE